MGGIVTTGPHTEYPGITQTEDAAGNARYLGEIVNNSNRVACNIGVSINSYDASGVLLTNPGNQQFGFANLLGETFRFSSSTTQTMENCLSPGHRASFDIRNDFPLMTGQNPPVPHVAWIEASTTCDGVLFDGCASPQPPNGQPFAYPVAVLGIEGSVTEGVDGLGHVVYTGTVRNKSLTGAAPTYHVKIVFTARNAAGLVTDVACATIDGPECPVPQGSTPANTGLGPGDSWMFSVPLSIPPSETCSGCFSYIINQKPSL
ncbi:MAG TPA: hypothetical protein VFN94_05800 [Nitrospiria bacterium]|nr:hypothetical protein [Nitrospiria bacterium]